MTITLSQIDEFRDWAVNTYHSNRVRQQEIDEEYIQDIFKVPFVPQPTSGSDTNWTIRTGDGFRMVNGPAEHIVSRNPQYSREPRKNTETQAAARIASEGNRWISILKKQNPQPFREATKKVLGRGEGYLYTPHNPDYDPDDPNSMPFFIILPDPMIVFPDDLQQENNGIPSRVLVTFNRTASSVKQNYPDWAWSNQQGRKWTDTVPFTMYFDDEVRYFSADNEPLLRDKKGKLSNGAGLQENIYHFVPFVHFYTGFGTGSADGDPANLAVGRLRYTRDLIAELCAMKSVKNYLIHTFAHKSIDFLFPADGPEPSGDIGAKYDRSQRAWNQIAMPPGASINPSVNQLPDDPFYRHYYDLQTELAREDPIGLLSGTVGSSGRQQDMAAEAGLRRYDTIVENTETAFSTAFGLGLRMCEKLPDMLPPGIHKGDINGYYSGQIELKAADPLEQDRLRVMGSRLYQQGEIDLETNLVDYQNYTQEQAKRIKARILADKVSIHSPVVAEMLGVQAAQEMGAMEEYQAIKESRRIAERPQPAIPQFGVEGGEPRVGNIKTPRGREEADMSLVQRGVRRSSVE